MKKLSLLLLTVVLATGLFAQDSLPGPYFKQINNDSIYNLPEPPAYKPFSVYGMFLVDVAIQNTQMVLNPVIKVPETVEQIKDLTFKEIDGEKIGVDIYMPKGDTTANPLILIIHGGYC